MLAKSLVEEIDQLIKQGALSQRKIAAKLNVSRGTVSQIASGRRRHYGHLSADEEPGQRLLRTVPRRCPCCGYRVYMPCLICRGRKLYSRRTKPRTKTVNHTQRAVRLSQRAGQSGESSCIRAEF